MWKTEEVTKMNSYKQHGNETKFDEREVAGYLAQYQVKQSEGTEEDEADDVTPASRGKYDVISALAEPEDWERGYD